MPLTRIDPKDFVFNNDPLSVSCWRNENGNPVGDTEDTPTFLDSGTVNGVNSYYLGNPANLQFSRAIANKNAPKTAFSRKIYGAIRNIVVGDVNADIKWTSDGAAQPQFNVISISKNAHLPLLPGSLRYGDLTDNSNISPPRILNCGRAYTMAGVTSGPFRFGYGDSSPAGLFLPDVGLILTTNSIPSTFVLSTENPTPTNHVFIRARNNQYNYSMNPSFISGSSGYIINKDWFDNPQTYITTVGLYNDNNELMATAKLPRPYNKNFNNELLMQIGLNF
jgi:hypothetical protein